MFRLITSFSPHAASDSCFYFLSSVTCCISVIITCLALGHVILLLSLSVYILLAISEYSIFIYYMPDTLDILVCPSILEEIS
jgi:hypothetical protein